MVLFRSSLGEFLGAIGVMGKTFKNKLEPGEDLIIQITELANIARKGRYDSARGTGNS